MKISLCIKLTLGENTDDSFSSSLLSMAYDQTWNNGKELRKAIHHCRQVWATQPSLLQDNGVVDRIFHFKCPIWAVHNNDEIMLYTLIVLGYKGRRTLLYKHMAYWQKTKPYIEPIYIVYKNTLNMQFVSLVTFSSNHTTRMD